MDMNDLMGFWLGFLVGYSWDLVGYERDFMELYEI